MDEEKVDETETNETQNTETVDSGLENELKEFMSTIEGQISNLTQMIEKMNPVEDETPEASEEPESESEPETVDDEAIEKDADKLLNDI